MQARCSDRLAEERLAAEFATQIGRTVQQIAYQTAFALHPLREPDVTIVDDEALAADGRAIRTYRALSFLAAVGIVLFFINWFTMAGRWQYPVMYIVATMIIGFDVAVWAARWVSIRRMRRPRPIRADQKLRVAVATSFVPSQESHAMLDQTVRALVAMDYPHSTWVLDEGDDPAVRELCVRLGARHFTRRHHPQYQAKAGQFAARTKHGNYNAWLTEHVYDHCDVVVNFDPDHVPEWHYLSSVLGYFRDPGIAYVQAPQVYYNQGASLVAQGAAEETYAYYSSHQMASYALGHPIVIGSHGAHRVRALQELGGFPAHDAEDLYLTMLYQAKGWRGVYVPRILAMGTAPVDWAGYLVQQMRWARSVIDLKRRPFRLVAPMLSPMEKALNLFHGVYYLRPLMFIAMYALLIEMLLRNAVPAFLAGPQLLAIGTLIVLLRSIDLFRQRFYLHPRERGMHWRAALLQFAKWPHLAGALVDAVLGRHVPYAITPKTRQYQSATTVLAPVHIALAAVITAALALGLARHGSLAPQLVAIAGALVVASLALASSEAGAHAVPYDPDLLTQRRMEVADGLWPGPQRVQGDRRRVSRPASTYAGRRGDRPMPPPSFA